ncbi:MAG: response regulator transcription factor [Eubacteriales bacterium]|nr:response regulator transcription factor [Eubacteriales bacterium]
MYRIFIVEDDPVISRALAEHLQKWGYDVLAAQDFSDIDAQFARYDPQLVLMDISLPFYNGYHWCSQIRRVSKVPVIFISSASDNMNIVMAMNMGADDFVTKPFNLEVLAAKVQAMLRRAYAFAQSSPLLTCRGAVLNLGDASLTWQDEKIELTKNEFRILQVLMDNVGKTVARDVLMKKLWEDDCFVDDNTLSVNVARLRKKLEDAGLHDFILTRKGLGYWIDG